MDLIKSFNIKKVFEVFLVLLISVYIFYDCTKNDADTSYSDSNYPKYIFLFIGDGMGNAQIQLASDYMGMIKHPVNIKPESLSFLEFPVAGMATNYDAMSYIPDSASSGSAIASGAKIRTGSINYDGERTYQTIAEKLKAKKHYKVGIVSSVNVNHTTPGDFYAHQESRKNDYGIGLELIKSQFDYFAGGGFREECGADGLSESLGSLAEKAGYTVLKTRGEQVTKDKNIQKLILISDEQDSQGALPYAIDNQEKQGALKNLVQQGASFLETNNKNGFFLMAEGGKIDWACHQNDTATCIKEVCAFDKAVQAAVDFYKKHKKETLIIVTADHETGGLSLGYSETGYTLYLDQLANQKISYEEFNEQFIQKYKREKTDFQEVLADVELLFGLTTDAKKQKELGIQSGLTYSELKSLREAYEETLEYGNRKQSEMTEKAYAMHGTNDPFTSAVLRILANKSGISWSTYAHSGVCVPVFAMGCGQELFEGYYDNTDICKNLEELLGV